MRSMQTSITNPLGIPFLANEERQNCNRTAFFEYDPLDQKKRPLNDYQRLLIQETSSMLFKLRRAQIQSFPGTGKTLVANVIASQKYVLRGERVVWISHNWTLNAQAASDILRRHGDRVLKSDIAWLGSQESQTNRCISGAFRNLRDNPNARIVFVTWQTLSSMLRTSKRRAKAKELLGSLTPGLVVIDESHWGVGGACDRFFRQHILDECWRKSAILGLSATPKRRAGFGDQICGGAPLAKHVEDGHVAKPIEVRVQLKARTRIHLDANNKIDNYAEIASDTKRNREIADHYYQNLAKYGKTLIFACNCEHANLLGKLLRGHNPLVIHGGVSHAHDLLRKFKNDPNATLAIVVGMCKEGTDFPDLKTVILAKPTTSETEFVQMVGRGSRITPTKKSFYIVDFYDNLENPEVSRALYHFNSYYNDSDASQECRSSGSHSQLSAAARRPYHSYVNVPATELLTVNQESESLPQSLDGLWINPLQTFGIEFEIRSETVDYSDRGEWTKVARDLIGLLVICLGKDQVNPLPVRDRVKDVSYSVWNVVYDGSCGWEIVTPILCGREGFEIVAKALRALNTSTALSKYKLGVSNETGTHVHFGWQYRDTDKFVRIVQWMRRFEAAFFTLVGASRFGEEGEPNEYCQPVGYTFDDIDVASFKRSSKIRERFCDDEMRYLAINLSHFDSEPQRIEVRMHSGTLDAQKILAWISLWMNVFNAIDNFPIDVVSHKGEMTMPKISEHEDCDVVAIAAKHLGLGLEKHRRMLEIIHRRRATVFGNDSWRRVVGAEKQRKILLAWEQRYEKYLNHST